jgi:hypothetical protein
VKDLSCCNLRSMPVLLKLRHSGSRVTGVPRSC